MAHCLWDNYEGHHKYHLASWDMVTMKKEYGGLGIPNIRDLNLVLLASWIHRYKVDNHRLWKQIVGYKYNTANPNIFAGNDINSWACRAASSDGIQVDTSG